MSAYTLAEDRGLLSPDLIASLNFLPMASVIGMIYLISLAFLQYLIANRGQICADVQVVKVQFPVAYTGYGLGYGVIPSLLAAEMMPVDVRSTAVGFFMTVEMTSTFLLSKLKPLLMDTLRIHGLFAMFAGAPRGMISLSIYTMTPVFQALFSLSSS